jgi:ribosomal protein S18 acetylase RimI-like enzyme
MRYSLRNSTGADKAWLEKLRRVAYDDLFYATWGGWDEKRHLRHFAECWEQGSIQLVEIDRIPIGMIQVLELADHLEVGEIQILPEQQSKGIGSQILEDLLQGAREQGKDVVLSTGLKNLRAFQLYERLGFKEVDRSDTHFHMSFSEKVN